MKLLSTLQIQHGRVISASCAGTASADPMETVLALMDRGCSKLCILDVNAARGTGQNREAIAQVIQRVHHLNHRACIQVGGGIRSSDQAQFYLDCGASWLLVGTILHRSPSVVEQMLARFREHMTAAIDVKDGIVQASGWTENMETRPEEAARQVREYGFRRILFSDVPGQQNREPDFATAAKISENAHIPMLMGGTLKTPDHLVRAAKVPGLCGVLVDALTILETPELTDHHQPCV